VNLRLRLLMGTDRLLAAVLAATLIGTTLSFGGAVWWAKPVIAVLTLAFVLATLLHILLEGKLRVLKSPLTVLGALGVGLAAVQLASLPGTMAGVLSPHSREVYVYGRLPRHALVEDSAIALPEPVNVRSPVTLDRAATLRWLVGAVACLALFWGVGHFVDRQGHLFVVWGSLIAGFALNTAFALVQIIGGADGLFGFLEPGKGRAWAPSVNDLLTSPNASALRVVGESGSAWTVAVPDRPFLLGTLMGGPGAYLALGSIALPLALALALQLMAPRGSREGLMTRLRQSGQGSLVFLLVGLVLTSAALTGLMAGLVLCLPFAIALVLVGFPCAWPAGLRWAGVGLTSLTLLALGAGVALGDSWSRYPSAMPSVRVAGLAAALRVWADTWPMLRDFPVFGTGLGSFPSVYPFYKSLDPSQTTALSSLIEWVVESGLVGVALLVAGGYWCLQRLPGAVRRVGSADRALVFGLIGAATGFSLFSAVHWTVELPAVAVSASAFGGICNRWLSGGTDLFVERA
jgi:hypothetical protein